MHIVSGGAVSALLRGTPLPKMFPAQQQFPRPRLDPAMLPGTLARQLAPFSSMLRPGMRVAITAGSRGVANAAAITRTVAGFVKACGASPFIVPAMGSHGGATAQGQLDVLAGYGITAETMGCPILSDMTTVRIGALPDGRPVFLDRNAAQADGIIVCCRVKPHNAFRHTYESGILKMLAVGLGKQQGAQAVHAQGMGKIGQNVEAYGRCALENTPVLFAVASIENAYDETARIAVVPKGDILSTEPQLLREAFDNMPRLIVGSCDVLIVDEIGKNYSGSGVDPNICGTFSTPYASGGIQVKRTAMLRLSAVSHGNALGVGLADVIPKRLYEQIDPEKMYPNCITSTVLTTARIPCVVATDKEAIQLCLRTCNEIDLNSPRVVRIANSLHVDRIALSQAYYNDVRAGRYPNLCALDAPGDMQFDAQDALI